MTGRGGILGLDPEKGDQILVDKHLYPGLDRAHFFELTADPRPAGDGTLWVQGRLVPFRWLGEAGYGPVVELHITYPAGLVVQRADEEPVQPSRSTPAGTVGAQAAPDAISEPAPSWFDRGTLPRSRPPRPSR